MATMYPEVFPGAFDQSNPEFIVYQTLRTLPNSYIVFYSKRLFKGGLFSRQECEIDFIIFNQRDVIICLEVKGGVLSYDGAQDCWRQNGKVMGKSPDRQATDSAHTLIRELSKELRNANVDWACGSILPSVPIFLGGSQDSAPRILITTNRTSPYYGARS